MKNKNMYYVFEVEEVVQNIEPFEQYGPLGEDLHKVIVNRKPILVAEKNGKYITEDGQLVVVEKDFERFAKSYRTKASIHSSIVGSGRATAGDLKRIGLSSENIAGRGGISTKHYALPVPAEKYEKEISIIDKAKAFVGKPIILSEDTAEADKQLAGLGINIEEMRREAQAQQSQPE